jgi:peptidoglycan/LPS O-acetylase OafA/YrhL
MWLLSKKIIGKKMCQTLVIGFFLMPFIIIPFIIIHYQYYYLSRLSSVLTTKESWFYLDIGFDKLYIRSGPILYGLITAYFLVYHKDKLQDFIKRLSTTYVSAISVLLFATLYFVLVNDPIRFFEKSMDVWQTSTYWGLLIQHHLFALALCLLLLLANAPKGIIMVTAVKILSSVVLRPLGRLSYTTYMIHPVVFLLGYSVFFATHTSVSALDYVQQGLWLILITYLLAIPCHLLIEHPALKIKNWRDIFFSSLQGTSKEPTP